jgi:hypothetical protein
MRGSSPAPISDDNMSGLVPDTIRHLKGCPSLLVVIVPVRASSGCTHMEQKAPEPGGDDVPRE